MLRIGVAGYPLGYTRSPGGRSRFAIFPWLERLGLDALELQMTYGPRTKPETCRELRQFAEDHGITLSVHASYFIVLTSPELEKVRRSIDTLKRTADLASELGATVAVLHPGSMYGAPPNEALSRFVENGARYNIEYGSGPVGIFVETAGKLGQLGSVPEILRISAELPNFHPCIDFGHVHARTLGMLHSKEALAPLFTSIGQFMARHPAKRCHFHFTPIHFGPRGEIQHRAIADRYDGFEASSALTPMPDGFFHPRPENVAHWLRQVPFDATVISETHNSQEIGALALKSLV